MNSHTPKLNNRRHIERHIKTGNHKKVSCFLRLFSAFLKNRRIAPRKGKYDTLFVWQFSIFGGVGNERKMKKFPQIPAYSGLCGVVGNERNFLQINVHFAFCGFVGIREKCFRSFGRIPAPSVEGIRKFHEIFPPERNKPAANSRIVSEQTTQRSFLEQDSTTVPKFAYCSFCPAGILLGLPPQARLFAACAA
jgi:hypothetical protein